ncbi:UDP-N-acetylmuramoyl-L-alanine--D-glutamate ligase [Nitrincola alkalilacustris]|uniref:UDP-N-acetylmuramoyl-L-alanine--D-glutamate ligase n=1 Tax=Nitrincola alkalilacustris TaxID=1571224 RepID=UPI00124C5429|nr:UDP-N-acetylmuramoyl-L-alanine--D-glutamate ligase [Nitrincola alkalilacustris]
MSLIATDTFRIIIGLGQTGLSCARYLAGKGWPFAVVDTRDEPPLAAQFRAEFPDIELRCGELDASLLRQADELLLSPGVAKSAAAIQEAVAAGARLAGDIDLFCREANAPIVAITGSNAKSTVTTLVGEMARAAGMKVGVGGNIGTPALDLLAEGEADLYVLELSSFQLETLNELRAAAATVLNISPDHLDRYAGLTEYYQAKHRIYRGCLHAVINRDDPLTAPLLSQGVKLSSFGLSRPDLMQFGLVMTDGVLWLHKGLEPLMPASEVKIPGQHNLANVLAALALGDAVSIPMPAMLQAVKSFTGLRHRCQWVAQKQGVIYVNDSKGTNVGATLAAIKGLGETLQGESRIVLIAGGVGKEQSFTELSPVLGQYGRALVLIGEDAPLLDQDITSLPKISAATLQEAVEAAAAAAQPGDIVLLSPACASFDMFSGYGDRGDQFMQQVEALC